MLWSRWSTEIKLVNEPAGQFQSDAAHERRSKDANRSLAAVVREFHLQLVSMRRSRLLVTNTVRGQWAFEGHLGAGFIGLSACRVISPRDQPISLISRDHRTARPPVQKLRLCFNIEMLPLGSVVNISAVAN